MMMLQGQGGKGGYQGDDAAANDGFFSMYNSKCNSNFYVVGDWSMCSVGRYVWSFDWSICVVF